MLPLQQRKLRHRGGCGRGSRWHSCSTVTAPGVGSVPAICHLRVPEPQLVPQDRPSPPQTSCPDPQLAGPTEMARGVTARGGGLGLRVSPRGMLSGVTRTAHRTRGLQLGVA